MLHKQLKEDYFRNEHKFILPAPTEEEPVNKVYAATVAAEFASNGFPISTSSLEELSKCSVEDIVNFRNEYTPIIKDVIGSDHSYRPFYPNFPEEVLQMSDAEMFFDQIVYGFSGLMIEPELYETATERFPFVGDGIKHVISAGSEENYHESMKDMMGSAIAYSHAQRNAISDYFKYSKESVDNIPDISKLKNHENRVVLASALEDADKHNKVQSVLPDVTDVLRYAAVLSAKRDLEANKTATLNAARMKNSYVDNKEVANTIYQYSSLRFNKNDSPSFTFSRKQRRDLALLLEKASEGNTTKTTREMQSHKKEWKRLIKNLHIGEIKGCNTVKESFALISTNAKGYNPRTGIEEATKANDLNILLDELKKSPGEFIRRFDKVLTMAIGTDYKSNEKLKEELKNAYPQFSDEKVNDIVHNLQKDYELHGNAETLDRIFDMLKESGEKAGVATLYSLDSHIKGRNTEETSRIFRTPSNNKTTVVNDKNRSPLPDEIIDKVHSSIMDALSVRYRNKEPMGNVYISPEMKNYRIPSDMRNAGDGIQTYGPGSRIAMSNEKECKRLFVHWTNMNDGDRIDNDLSASMYGKDGKYMGMVGWNASYAEREHRSVVFSGDVQDGGPANGEGRAEFIDFDVKKLKEIGAKYIVPSVNSFCGQPFNLQPHTKFGIMERDPKEMGEVFEPKSVQEEYALTVNATAVVPLVYDIEENRMIWLDLSYNDRIASRSQDTIASIIELAENKSESIEEIAHANAVANGQIVDNPLDADTLFVTPMEMAQLHEENLDINFDDKKIVYPYDMTYIMGVLMADGEPNPPEKEINKDYIEQEVIDMDKLDDTKLSDLEIMLEQEEDFTPKNRNAIDLDDR